MAEPETWQALEFVRSRVQLIRKASGYYTDLGMGAIALDDSELPDDAATPCTVIEAQQVAPTGSTGQSLTSDMDVIVEYGLPRGRGEVNPKLETHRARRDLVRALTVNKKELPIGVASLEIADTQLGGLEEDRGVSLAIAQVTVRVALTELKTPATQP